MSPAIEKAAKVAIGLIERLDLSADEAELAATRDELARIGERDRETRAEAARLAQAIAEYEGPDPQKVADAIMAGAALEDAAFASPARSELEERRAALLAALGPIRERTDSLSHRIRELRGAIGTKALATVQPIVDAINEEAREAAETLMATHAARSAIARSTGCWVEGETEGRAAVEALAGQSRFLGYRTAIEVPEAILGPLAALSGRVSVVATPPAKIAT